MSESDYRKAVRETQEESSTADQPEEGAAPSRDPAETGRGDESDTGRIPPGSNGDGDEDEIQKESSTADHPGEGAASSRNPAKTARGDESDTGGVPPGSSGHEDDYESGEGH